MRIHRIAAKLLLLNALVACGPPGTDSLFTPKQKTQAVATVDTTPKVAVPAPTPVESKMVKGLFRFTGDTMLFRPCGSRQTLQMFGSPIAMFRVRERFRWVGVWLNTELFGVFHGAVVVDTPTVKSGGADTAATGQPRTRFMIVDLDTLRTVNESDCGGIRKR